MSHRNVRSSVYVAGIACYRSREGTGGVRRPEEVAGAPHQLPGLHKTKWSVELQLTTRNRKAQGQAAFLARTQP